MIDCPIQKQLGGSVGTHFTDYRVFLDKGKVVCNLMNPDGRKFTATFTLSEWQQMERFHFPVRGPMTLANDRAILSAAS